MEYLPDSLLLQIFDNLQFQDVISVAQVCGKFHRVAEDELLWRRLFHRHYGCSPNKFANPLCNPSWKAEFIRLYDEIPIVETEVVTKHTDQVLHVSFSHDGQRFATTAKDGFVNVWRSDYPVKLEYSANMKTFSWKYTQFSQFNESDSLLLVSGVLFGLHSTSGEIAVFSLKDGFQLQCRTMSKPYDVFGCWYSDMFFLSGNLHWLGHMVSKSVIWLNKASQESESEHTSVMNELYRFHNANASSVRNIMVANCWESEVDPGCSCAKKGKSDTDNLSEEMVGDRDARTGNPLSNLPLERELLDRGASASTNQGNLHGGFQSWKPFGNVPDIKYSNEHCLGISHSEQGSCIHAAHEVKASASSTTSEIDSAGNSLDSILDTVDDTSGDECDGMAKSTAHQLRPQKRHMDPRDSSSKGSSIDEESEDDFLDSRAKWLIYTCGTQTYTPHQIGFKKISPITFNGRIDPGPPLKDRIEEYKRRRQLERDGEQDFPLNLVDQPRGTQKFDEVDKIIDLHGHIIGMALSPDHHFLYVNSRPWPEGYKISDPLEPPPIAQEIDIHVIDLSTLAEVGVMRRAHRAYTPNDECFFIFLDASDMYLASGAEDRHGYLWDRFYGISLAKIPHNDVVNSVAFNPKEPEMLISVSDDMTIKIWRSRNLSRKLGLPNDALKVGTKLYGPKTLSS